jgi:GDP-L-fucose synthase
MGKHSKILVLGGTGLVGTAIVTRLADKGYDYLHSASSKLINLLDRQATIKHFEEIKPEWVFVAAAKVGGIVGNRDHPADFGDENALIALNTMKAAKLSGVEKLLFLGSSCIYPKNCAQPIKEEFLLSGKLEETNKMYALSKIMGLEMCDAYREQYGCNFISAMPCNLYGPNDNFHPKNSHVIPALLDRFHNAKVNGDTVVTCWGDGTPRREFLFVEDLADACVWLMENYDEPGTVNVGTGEDVTLKELVATIMDVVEYDGHIEWDTSYPNGTMQKLLDVSKLNDLGWESSTPLRDGLRKMYKWYLSNLSNLRRV